MQQRRIILILLVCSVLATGCSNNMGKENTEEIENSEVTENIKELENTKETEQRMSENQVAEGDISEIKEPEPDSSEAASDSRYSCIAVEDGFELTFYSSTNEIIFSERYPKEPAISQVTENIFEIRISVGSPAAYVCYFDMENAEKSDTFFNPLLIGDRYVAYMEDGKLILQDIFHEDSLYTKISRNFTQTADPMSAIIAIEMQDDGTIALSYYKGEDYEETSEIITAYSYEIRESQYTLENGYTFTNVQVFGMGDSELEEKINDTLSSRFYLLDLPWFTEENIEERPLTIHCKTDRYLSIQYNFSFLPNETVNGCLFLCITVDMQSGEIVFLNDLIDVNEGFVDYVIDNELLHCEESILEDLTSAENSKKLNESYRSRRQKDYFLRHLESFTEEELYGRKACENDYEILAFNTSTYHDYFYLEEGKIFFRGTSSDPNLVNWILAKDLEDYLKVPGW